MVIFVVQYDPLARAWCELGLVEFNIESVGVYFFKCARFWISAGSDFTKQFAACGELIRDEYVYIRSGNICLCYFISCAQSDGICFRVYSAKAASAVCLTTTWPNW